MGITTVAQRFTLMRLSFEVQGFLVAVGNADSQITTQFLRQRAEEIRV